MGYSLDYIKLKNFKVFEDVYVDFSQYKKDDKVLIIGENHDEAGADSNGSGKTTLFEVIAWLT